MLVEAGARDRHLTFMRSTVTFNAMNEPVRVWSVLANAWGNKKDVSDRERMAAMEVSSTISTRFVIPWTPTLATLNGKDRVVCDGLTYDIQAVKEIGRRDGLEVSATVGND